MTATMLRSSLKATYAKRRTLVAALRWLYKTLRHFTCWVSNSDFRRRMAAFASTAAILSAHIRCLCQLHVGQGLAAVYLNKMQGGSKAHTLHSAFVISGCLKAQDREFSDLLQPRRSSPTMSVFESPIENAHLAPPTGRAPRRARPDFVDRLAYRDDRRANGLTCLLTVARHRGPPYS
jgi:hypothetical protein